MRGAPKLGEDSDEQVVKYIDQYQTCEIPINEELSKQVLQLQKHVHSASCRRNGSCRYQYPRLPSDATVIAKESDKASLNNKKIICKKVMDVMEAPEYPDDISLEDLLKKAAVEPHAYKEAVKTMKSGKQVVLKRQPGERWINNYNTQILKTWGANMDLQYIVDPYSCIMYITSYMMKSEGAMSELLKGAVKEFKDEDVRTKLQKVGAVFLSSREISAQEATFRLLSIPLKQSSKAVVFVNTSSKDKRVSLLKPKQVLEEMNDDDEDIFHKSLTDRYVARPDNINHLCLAEFAASYTVGGTVSHDETDHVSEVGAQNNADRNEKVITLKNGLGKMKKRNQQCVIRFYKRREEDDEKYRGLIMLYLPWRDESVDLKGNFLTFHDHYQHVKKEIQTNEKKFSIRAQEIDDAYETLQQNGPPNDAWDMIAPNIGFEEAEQRAEGFVIERDLPNVDPSVNIDIGSEPIESKEESLFSKEIDPSLMTPEQYKEMTLSLNAKQRQFLAFHQEWLKQVQIAITNCTPIPQYTVFLSGHGGVGKSHIIKLAHYETLKLLKLCPTYFHPNDIPVLRTAFTGTAAFGIDGMTLHSAFGFTVGPNRKKEYQPPGSSKLNTLRAHLGKLKLLVIDEASMVGADLLYDIHRRLQDITENRDQDTRFGGVSILAVGDLYQLQPVGQKHIFGDPSDDYARLHGSIWKETFILFELTESMRQKDDQAFAELLKRVRTAECTEDDLSLLQSREVTTNSEDYPSQALHVFKTNEDVDYHNMKQITLLGTHVETIKAIDFKKDVNTGQMNVKFSRKMSETGGLREIVSVTKAARVMVTVNIDVSDGLVNGVTGTVVGLDKTADTVNVIFILFDSKRVGAKAISKSKFKHLHPNAVPVKRHDVQFFAGGGKSPIMAKRSQFPLTLAWACTIHKVQGKTLEQIVVSMKGKGRFNAGQAYVALSRVKKISGLHILQFEKEAIRVNKDVVKEMRRIPRLTFLEEDKSTNEE